MAIQEAQMVLRAAGVAGIRIWNDPDHSLRCTKYTTYRRAPKAARDAHIAAIIRTKKKQYAAGVLPKWQKERLERIPGWSWTAA